MPAVAQTETELSDYQAGALLPAMRARFEAAYAKARRAESSPWRTFDFQRERILGEVAGSPARQQLALLRRAADQFESWAADPASWPTTRFAEEQAAVAQVAAAAATLARVSGVAFSAPAFLAALRGRGITITFDDGHIVVSPPDMLNETDRRLLRTHRLVILDALTSTEKF